MEWLNVLKNNMLKITQQEAMKNWPPFPGCSQPYFDLRYEHVKHVEKGAMKLYKKYGGDIDIILASVWIHDIAKFEIGDHAKNAAVWTSENLYKTDFPEHKINDVVYAVSVHSGWVISDIKSIEAKILWDADKLSHFGPAWFMDSIFTFTSQEVCKRENEPEIIKFHETISMDNFLIKFMGFKNKLDDDRINSMFYLEESKELAKKYMDTVADFYDTLEKQLM